MTAETSAIWDRLPAVDGRVIGELSAGEAMLAGLSQCARPALRWYHSHETALVLGAGQSLLDVDRAALRRRNIALYRRASGGGAVLWTPQMLMLDIALPHEHPLALHDVSRSYEWLGRVWQRVLQQLGLPAQLISIAAARLDRAQLTPALQRVCFAGQSPAEVLVEGRKLVGLAQVRRRHGFLFQVGIYRVWPAALISELLGHGAESAGFSERLAARVTALDELGVTVDDRELMRTFEDELTAYGVLGLHDREWRTDEVRAAAAQTRFVAIEPESPE